MTIVIFVFASLILRLLPVPGSYSTELLIESVIDRGTSSIPPCGVDLIEFLLNLDYLESEFFLFGLTMGGPAPICAKKANLDSFTQDIALQFGKQQVGDLRAIKNATRGFPRPLLDLSARSFAKLIAGLLGVKSGQDAIIRTLLYEKENEKVHSYGIPVASFTNKISEMRNNFGLSGLKDKGLLILKFHGNERKIRNVFAGNEYAIVFDGNLKEILRIIYGVGNERIPGGSFSGRANGRIARFLLHRD